MTTLLLLLSDRPLNHQIYLQQTNDKNFTTIPLNVQRLSHPCVLLTRESLMEFENFSVDLLKRATGININVELILGRLNRNNIVSSSHP